MMGLATAVERPRPKGVTAADWHRFTKRHNMKYRRRQRAEKHQGGERA